MRRNKTPAAKVRAVLTQSIVMRSKSGTIRFVDGEHQASKWEGYAPQELVPPFYGTSVIERERTLEALNPGDSGPRCLSASMIAVDPET